MLAIVTVVPWLENRSANLPAVEADNVGADDLLWAITGPLAGTSGQMDAARMDQIKATIGKPDP